MCILELLSFACVILHAMFVLKAQPHYVHMEQVVATLPGSAKMPQIQT